MTLVAWCGDSIIAGTTASWRRDVRTQALKYLGARISAESINAGVGGERSDELLARMPDILAQSPGLAFALIGTNDAGQSIPLADFKASIEGIREAAAIVGVPVAFGLVPPRGYAGPEMDLTRRYNLWLRAWCHRNGIPCADTYGALVDPATGLLAAAYDSGDGVHPSNAGHAALGEAVAAALDLPLPTWPVTSAGEGMLPDPLAAGTSGWAFLAGAYTAPTRITDAGLPAGSWLRLTYSNTTGSTGHASWGSPLGTEGVAWAEGDVLLVAMHIRGSTAAAINKVQLMDGSGPAVGAIVEVEFPTATPGPLLRKITIPAVAGTLRLGVTIQAAAGQTATVDIGACDVYNLTRLGLEDLEV